MVILPSWIEIFFIVSIVILYFLPKKSDKWKWLRYISLCAFVVNLGIRLYLINRGHEHVKEIEHLRTLDLKYSGEMDSLATEITELGRRANIIQSIELHISIDAVTTVRPTTAKSTSVGVQSAVALFSEDNTRYRFVTDYQWSIQQVSPTLRRISFVYKPEEPSQLLGHQIEFLEQMELFVCNYSGFFKQRVSDDTGSEGTYMNLTILLNGLDVITLRKRYAAPGVLFSGQAKMDMSKEFANISERYALRLRAKSGN